MWKFDFPWMFLLLPLPALVWWLAPGYRTTSKAVRMPFFQEMADAAGEKPAPGGVRLRRNGLQRILMPLLWALLVAAAAKPVYVEAPITREEPARDLMLAIDLSQSMSARDFVSAATGERMDRLTAVRRVVADFIAKRKSDRIGLIVFGDAAYPQAPLTLDHDSVLILLDQMQIGMAGPRTAIGDAVGLSVKLMDKTPAPEKVLILLTDGNDTASAIPPQRAAEIAKDHRIVVHTIGIGDPETTGEDKVDLDALKRISDATGGRSFHALGRQEDLAAVYTTLDRITPDKVKREVYRPQRDYFWIPLALALSLLTAYHVVAWLIAMLRAPRRGRANFGEATHGN
ncbi:von Willebrand factor type A domain protein [Caballeronia arationis]|jgi:Ca-activated chloride channel family protein|uniref:Mg-chelatase subunit ChlD n=1 Tax=Caballeronia arationis TaxID=1777142 RepID=A0A7Z7ICZ9_9BURK|nr:VWA domain-containing protein [Caballeronia arationis]SAK45158.1 von Willebrand factor type A domain protein [Caballeronia arationis]SOE88434.1 Mg-chelatase subunit ChlD [Caballeronia arationis]